MIKYSSLLCLVVFILICTTAISNKAYTQEHNDNQPSAPGIPDDIPEYQPSPPPAFPSQPQDENGFVQQFREFFGFDTEPRQQDNDMLRDQDQLGPGCSVTEEQLQEFFEQYEMM